MEEKELSAIRYFLKNNKMCGPVLRGLDTEKIYNICYIYSHAPKCSICENSAAFDGFNRGYKPTCSNPNCVKKHRQNVNKSNFKIGTNKIQNKAKDKNTEFKDKYHDLIVELYTTTNMTCRDISLKLNINYSTTQSLLRDGGYTKDYKTKKWYISQQKTLKQKLEKANHHILSKDFRDTCIKNQLTAVEIAKNLNCSPNYISTEFRRLGTPLRQKTQSSIERSLFDDISSIVRAKQSDRNLINPLELDIIIPQHKLAIEVNGAYWHSKKDRNYHLRKTNLTQQSGYHLLHFTDYDLNMKYDICRSLILANCGIFDNRIYARNCTIQFVNTGDYKNFCNENHIQGFCGASIKLGLYHKDELVSIMSFAKPRFNKKIDFEMIRYCNKLNVQIIGGASKLFNQFKKLHPNSSCISYCSRDKFTGDFHKYLGFELERITPPGYVWISKDDIKSRYQCQKHKLHTSLTENEYMSSLGYNKLYDCGQLVYTYK
jgi:very-short-patch-repair endonuclease